MLKTSKRLLKAKYSNNSSTLSLKTSLPKIKDSSIKRYTNPTSPAVSPPHRRLSKKHKAVRSENINIINNYNIDRIKILKQNTKTKVNSLEKKKVRISKSQKKARPFKKKDILKKQRQSGGEQDKWKQNLRISLVSKNYSQMSISFRNPTLDTYNNLDELSERQFSINNYQSLSKTFLSQNEKIPILRGEQRILLIEWLCFASSQLLLKRQTLHLTVVYLDNYLDISQVLPNQLYLLAGACLLLAVKQEQRIFQNSVMDALTESQKNITKTQLLEMQNKVVLKMNFKLSFNTLSFWVDYFTQKWDDFTARKIASENHSQKQPTIRHVINLRDPEGLSYKYYRELCELADLMVISSQYRDHDFSRLSLACMYLVTRVETEGLLQKKQMQLKQSHNYQLWLNFHQQFKKKASPIFRDPFMLNEIFNEFLTETCNFQITQIIPAIKSVSKYINLQFCFDIDQRVYERSNSYEDFIRYMTYSPKLKTYLLTNNLET